MMTRTGTIALGDWSDDGHGKAQELTVKMVGEDVRNVRLKKAYQDAVKATGVDLCELFEEYEKSDISFEHLKKICDSGYRIHTYDDDDDYDDEAIQTWRIFNDIPEEWYVDGDKKSSMISAGHMLMYYLGYGIPGFDYKFVKLEKDYIIGNWAEDAPVSSFGYGFFS